MKICAFYVTKNQRVIEEKDVLKAIDGLAKIGVSAIVISQITPIMMEFIGEPIVAHASSSIAYNGGAIDSGSLEPAVNKMLSKADEIVNALQRLAYPVSYGFALKGILEKMSGNEQVGSKHLKEALKGYVIIQVLPMLFDVINIFR